LAKFKKHRDAWRRAGFVFLSAWVHVAAAFYLTAMLFTGHTLNATKANTDPVKPKHIVEISFIPPQPVPTPPKPEAPPPELPFDPNALATIPPAPPEPLPPPPKPPEEKVDEKSIVTSDKEGILDCDSLDKKPERIVLGPTNINLPPQESATGELVLKIKIQRNGTVLNVTTENSTMTPRVQEKVIQWVANSLFHPGEMGGVKVDCEMRFEFSLSGPGSPTDAGPQQ
jgi:TonB family protein